MKPTRLTANSLAQRPTASFSSLFVSKFKFSNIAHKTPNVAVMLSGCGVYDGTEITEAVSTLINLSGRANYQCFSLNSAQMHTVNHTNGSEYDSSLNRNILEESARIARGNVLNVDQLSANDYDCIIFPGGFGAAKNFCDFGVNGENCSVNTDITKVILDFYSKGKPMGFCCIAPVLPARVLTKEIKDINLSVTVGHEENTDGKWPYADTAQAIKSWGATHVLKV